MNPGKTLSDLEAEQAVARVLDTAELPKGMRMDKPSDPYFAIPDFFLGKTTLDEATRMGLKKPGLSQIAPEFRGAFERLLGRQQNPMQTILGGMAKLSLVAQRNIFFRNVFDKNEELLNLAQKEIKATGKTDIMPMFAKSEDEARAFFGSDYRPIAVLDEGQRGRVGLGSGASNPFGQIGKTYYARKGIAEALEAQGEPRHDREPPPQVAPPEVSQCGVRRAVDLAARQVGARVLLRQQRRAPLVEDLHRHRLRRRHMRGPDPMQGDRRHRSADGR